VALTSGRHMAALRMELRFSPGDTAPIAVIDAVIDRRTERISSSGERRLAKRILCELHQTLFKGVSR